MKCAAHPGVETSLRCSKCDRPICPRCLVATPVGARCPQCARLSRLPTYQVPTRFILRAVAASLGTAAVCGILWGVLGSMVNFVYLNLLLGAGAGYAIGEATSLSANRKRGGRLALVAGVAAAACFAVSILPPWGSFFSPFRLMPFIISLASLAVAVILASNRLR